MTVQLAAQTGNADWLSSQLAKGVNIWRSKEGEEADVYMALYIAVENKHLEVVSIISQIADKTAAWYSIFRRFRNLLHTAVGNDDISMLGLLLKRVAYCNQCIAHGYTLLHIAAMYGNICAIELLLTYDDYLEVSAKAKDGVMPIYIAALQGFEDCIELLEKGGAYINACIPQVGSSPMSFAAWKGHLDAIRTLKMLGGDVNG
jgi:ankyrin repeat protein